MEQEPKYKTSQEVLNDFSSTISAKPNLTKEEIFSKFPEFKNDESFLQSAMDYHETSKSGKYKTVEELNSKFPEFEFEASAIVTEKKKPSPNFSQNVSDFYPQKSESSGNVKAEKPINSKQEENPFLKKANDLAWEQTPLGKEQKKTLIAGMLPQPPAKGTMVKTDQEKLIDSGIEGLPTLAKISLKNSGQFGTEFKNWLAQNPRQAEKLYAWSKNKDTKSEISKAQVLEDFRNQTLAPKVEKLKQLESQGASNILNQKNDLFKTANKAINEIKKEQAKLQFYQNSFLEKSGNQELVDRVKSIAVDLKKYDRNKITNSLKSLDKEYAEIGNQIQSLVGQDNTISPQNESAYNQLYSRAKSIEQERLAIENDPEFIKYNNLIEQYNRTQKEIQANIGELTNDKEYNKILESYNANFENYKKTTSELEKLKQYDPLVDEYVSLSKQVSNSDKSFRSISQGFLNKTELDRLQKEANLKGESGDFIGKSIGVLQSIPQAVNMLAAGSMDLLNSVNEWSKGNESGQQYTTLTKAADFYNNLSKVGGLIVPEANAIKKNGDLNWAELPYEAFQQLGNLAVLAVTGGESKAAMVTSSYLMSRKGRTDEAETAGLKGASKEIYVNGLSLLEGLSELIMPDNQFFTKTIKQKLLKDAVLAQTKGIGWFRKQALITILENMGKESLEEYVVKLGELTAQYANNLEQYANNLEQGKDAFDIKKNNTLNQWIRTGIVAAPLAGISTGISKVGVPKKELDIARFIAAKDLTKTREVLADLVEAGKMTTAKADENYKQIVRYAAVQNMIPKDISYEKAVQLVPLIEENKKLQLSLTTGIVTDMFSARVKEQIKENNDKAQAILEAPETKVKIQSTPEIVESENMSIQFEALTIELATPPSPFNKELVKLGYEESDIAKMTMEQKQEIVTNKTEAPIVESSAKVDSVKENARQEKIAEAQAKLDEEIKTETPKESETVVTPSSSIGSEVPALGSVEIEKEIADLRAKEQAEYDAMSNPKDKVKRKEIYDRYDKLITRLLDKQKAGSVGVGGDVKTQSQEEFAQYLQDNHSDKLSQEQIYKLLTVRPELRERMLNESPQEWAKIFEKNPDYRQQANNVDNNKEMRGNANPAWTGISIGETANQETDGRHKGYVTLSVDSAREMGKNLEQTFKDLYKVLKEAGYNGHLKMPGVYSDLLTRFDNIVIHGATKGDISLALPIIEQYFKDKGLTVEGTKTGIDAKDSNGKETSHTNLLAEKVKNKQLTKSEQSLKETPQAGSDIGGDAGTSLRGVKYSDIIVDDKYLEDILSDNKLSEDEKRQVREVFARGVDYFKFDKEGEQKFQEKFANPEDITDVADIITGVSAAQQSAFNFYNTKNYENVKDAVNYIANNPNEYSPKVVKAVKEIKEKLDNPSSSMSRLYAIDVMKELGISEQSLKETPQSGIKQTETEQTIPDKEEKVEAEPKENIDPERLRQIELLDTEKKIAQIEKEIRLAPRRGKRGVLSKAQLGRQLNNYKDQLRELKGLPPKKKVTDSVLRITQRKFANTVDISQLTFDEQLIFEAIGKLNANDRDIANLDGNKNLRKQGALVKQGGFSIDEIVTNFISENDLDADMAQDFRDTLIDFVNDGDAYEWMTKIKEREAQLDPDAAIENEPYNYFYDAAIENELSEEEINEKEKELRQYEIEVNEYYDSLSLEQLENITKDLNELEQIIIIENYGQKEKEGNVGKETDSQGNISESKTNDDEKKSALETKVKEAKNAYQVAQNKLRNAKQAADRAGAEQQNNIFGGKPADALLFGTDLQSLNNKVKAIQAEADLAKENLDKAQLALDSFVPSNQVQLEIEPTEAAIVKDPILKRLNKAFLKIGAEILDNAEQLAAKAKELVSGGAKIDFSMEQAISQSENIKLEYNSNGKHLAPNGKPSNLTEQQAKIVRTPAFKKWFGDWENDPKNASKIVDKNGEPMVVYHGTGSTLTEFDKSKRGSYTGAISAEKGFFVSDTKSIAESYRRAVQVENPNLEGLKTILSKLSVEELKQFGKGVMGYDIRLFDRGDYTKEEIEYELFRDIENDSEGYYADRRKLIEKASKYLKENKIEFSPYQNTGMLIEGFLNIKNPKKIDADSQTAFDIDLPKIIDNSISENKDGVWVENVYDSVSFDEKGNDTEEGSIMVFFEPNQIKLADGTNTTFDSKVNDFRYNFIEKTNVITNISTMKKNPNYASAKSGDIKSAVQFAKEILTKQHKEKIKLQLQKHKDAILVPVISIEAVGENKIPLAIANEINILNGNKIDENLYQSNKTFHTGASKMERFISRPEFDGEVKKGSDYILIDDVSTNGSTLKSLKDYIESNGGNVVETFVLGIGREGNLLEPLSEAKNKLIEKFGEKELNLLLNETDRKDINSLTAQEVKFLERFDTIDEIRREAIKEQGKQGDKRNEPLFHLNDKGEILGFTFNGKIYLNGEKITAKTTMEEAGHIWINWAKENRSDLYQQGLEKVQGSKYLIEVNNNPSYQAEALKQGEKGSDAYNAYMQEEALAKAIADNGAKFITETRKAGFREWVNAMWKEVAKAFGIQNLKPSEVKALTLEQFARMAAADVFSNKEVAPQEQVVDKANPKIAEAINATLKGEMNADDAAISLDEKGIEVTNEIYDSLRDAEKQFQKEKAGIQVGDIVMVKGRNGNPDFEANFRGLDKNGKYIVYNTESGTTFSITKDEIITPISKESELADLKEQLKKARTTPTKRQIQARIDELEGNEPKAPKGPSDGLGSRTAANTNTITPTQNAERVSMKFHLELKKLIESIGVPIAERNLSKRFLGLFKHRSMNIRVQSLFGVATAAHETAHWVSKKFGIGEALREKSAIVAANPDAQLNKDLRKALTEIYIEFYPNAKKEHSLRLRVEEGIAVLLEHYLTDPTDIANRYGILVDNFIAPTGKYYHPKFTELLDKLNKFLSEYSALTANEKIGSRIVSGEEVTKKNEGFTLAQSIVNGWVNSAEPLRRADNIADAGLTEESAEVAHLRWLSRAGIIAPWITGEKHALTLDRNGNWKEVGASVKDYLELIKGREIEFNEYLVARRNLGDVNYLTEMENELADILADIENEEDLTKEEVEEINKLSERIEKQKEIIKKDNFKIQETTETVRMFEDEFKKAVAIYDKLNNAVVDFAQKSGLLSQETAEAYKANTTYTSFKRLIHDDISSIVLAPGSSSQSQVDAFKTRTGSDLAIIDPVYSQIQFISETLNKGMQNMIWQRLAALGNDNVELARRFEKVETKRIVDPISGKITYPQMGEKGTIMVKTNGKPSFYLAAPEYVALAETLTPKELETMAYVLTKASGLFSRLTTSANPLFPLVNIPIDTISAWMNTKTGFIPIWSQMRVIPQMASYAKDKAAYSVKNLANRAIDFLHNMVIIGDWFSGIKNIPIKDLSLEEQNLFAKYLALGGSTQTLSAYQNMSPEEMIKAITGQSKFKKVFNKIIDLPLSILEMPSNASEYMTRFAEFKRAKDQGYSDDIAMYMAAHVSVPFIQSGTYGGQVGKTTVKAIPYFHSSIQVLAKFAQTAKNNPTRTATIGAALIAIKISQTLLTMALSDDEDKEMLAEQEPSELAKYIYVPNKLFGGKGFTRIRFGNEFGSISAPIEMMILQNKGLANYNYKDYLDATTTAIPQQFNIFKPVEAIWSYTPQIIRPSLEVEFNVRTYPNVRPIVPYGISFKSPMNQYNQYTTETSKYLGQLVGVSPMKIDYFVKAQFGKVPDMLIRNVEKIAFDKKDKSRSQIFLQEEQYVLSGRNYVDFYEKNKYWQQLYNDIRLSKNTDIELTNEQLETIQNHKIFDATSIVLAELRERVNKGEELSRETKHAAFELLKELNSSDKPYTLINEYTNLIDQLNK